MKKVGFIESSYFKRQAFSLLILITACTLLLLGCSKDENRIYIPYPGSGDTLSFTFKDGSKPFDDYYGTRDAVIKSSLKNYNFGITPVDTIGLINAISNTYEMRLMIAFDLSIIQSCSKVIEAKLTFSLASMGCTDSLTLEAYRVSSSSLVGVTWIEGSGGIDAGVSWLTIDGAAPWNNEGGDYINAVLDRVTVAGDTVVTFNLPPDIVLEWITTPSDNHGVIIIPHAQSNGCANLVHMSESLEISSRPSLWIKYIKGG